MIEHKYMELKQQYQVSMWTMKFYWGLILGTLLSMANFAVPADWIHSQSFFYMEFLQLVQN